MLNSSNNTLASVVGNIEHWAVKDTASAIKISATVVNRLLDSLIKTVSPLSYGSVGAGGNQETQVAG
jgi:hypothetical protein